MILTDKQAEGLKIALDRYNSGKKVTVISGYAGVGKTTLVKVIIDTLNVPKDRVVYTSYTGKAAEVLRKKGNKNAMTLHRLLYRSVPRPDGTFFRQPLPKLNYDIVVVDECSMVPKTLMDLLMTHKVHIIALGDPFQLPPVNKNEDNHLLDNPHIFLNEIVRQAKNSEIIQLTMKIRNHEPVDYMQGKEVMIIPKDELTTGMLQWADQILVGTNAVRTKINSEMRNILGFQGEEPQDGEKLICLRNYWDEEDCNESGDALVNGTTGILSNSFYNYRMLPRWINVSNPKIELIQGDFLPYGEEPFTNVEIDKKLITTGEKCVDTKTAYRLGKLKQKLGNVIPKEFDFAYAITCHRAQGSEWDKVLVIEERFPFDKEEHARWLYTACTRSSKKLILVK